MANLFTLIKTVIQQRKAFLTRMQILAKYGEPGPAYEKKYCILVDVQAEFPWFPVKHLWINVEFWAQLRSALEELYAKDLHKEIETCDGCLVIRNTRGTLMISLHAWAMAIDLNAKTNALGQLVPGWSPEFLEVMRKWVYCGSDFHGRRDPMHFSLYGE